jgi:hypothetical protein
VGDGKTESDEGQSKEENPPMEITGLFAAAAIVLPV